MDEEVERLTRTNGTTNDEHRFGQRNPTEIAGIPDGSSRRTTE